MANLAMVQQAPAGADFSGLGLGMLLPVTTGLQGWWFPGTDAPKSIANKLSGGAAAAVVGTPVFSAGFATFTSLTNYLQTSIVPAASRTYLAVARKPVGVTWDGTNATKGVLLGNFGTSAGSLLYTQTNPATGAANIADASYWSVGGTPTLRNTYAASAGSDFSTFALYAGVLDDTAKSRTHYDLTRGTSTTAAETGNSVIPGTNTVRIGSGYSNYAGQVDLAFAAVYSRALSKPEIDSIYAFVKSYLSRRSISI